MTKWQEFIELIGANRFRTNELAKLYIEVEKLDYLINIVNQAKGHNIPYYLIGAGTWPTIPKSQIDGLLIKNNCRSFNVYAMSGKMKEGQMGIDYKLVYAESGTIITQLVRFTIEEGLGGLEYHLGMPGTIGGAIFTNAKYAPKIIFISDFVEKLKILNKEGEIEEVDPYYFISRPHSEFFPANEIILSAIFRLKPEDKKVLWARSREASEYRANLVKNI